MKRSLAVVNEQICHEKDKSPILDNLWGQLSNTDVRSAV